MNPLVLLLIREILMPEIVAFIKAKQAANQPITEEELYVEFGERIGRILNVGQTWLDMHPKT
jgi:hypothetical protein